MLSICLFRLSLQEREYIINLLEILSKKNDIDDFPELKEYLQEARMSARIQDEIEKERKTKGYEYGLIHLTIYGWMDDLLFF